MEGETACLPRDARLHPLGVAATATAREWRAGAAASGTVRAGMNVRARALAATEAQEIRPSRRLARRMARDVAGRY